MNSQATLYIKEEIADGHYTKAINLEALKIAGLLAVARELQQVTEAFADGREGVLKKWYALDARGKSASCT